MPKAVALLLLGLLLPGCAGVPQTPTTATAEPRSTVASTPDGRAELERVMELRLDWGLRHDEEWVRQVAEAPDSVMSELGIPVAPDEAAELARMIEEEPQTRLIMYGAREHETFGGLWVDDPPFDMVMLFTDGLDRHRAAVAALAPDMRVDIRPARFSEAELRRLQDELTEEIRQLEGVEFVGSGVDVKRNVVTLTAKSNDATLQHRLEERYGGRLDVDIHALPGEWANAVRGAGWRLLAPGRSRRSVEPYTVAVATTAAEWQALWQSTDAVNPAPEIDLDHEIAVRFAHGIGSSCPELRLDDVVIDRQSRVVASVTSDPLAPRGCTDDLAGAAYFVVALQRQALPDSPFSVRLRPDWDDAIEVDLRP